MTAVGIGQEDLSGLRYPPADSIAWRAMQEGRGLIVQDVDRQSGVFLHLRHAVPVTQVMAVPLIGESGARGALIAGRIGRHTTFTAADLDMAETFAGQATIALELADARAAQQQLAALEDRDRIARDLHDHVIQRLFAVGLGLQGMAEKANESAIRARLAQAVEELDETISQIRTTIFDLQDTIPDNRLRSRVKAVVEELEPILGVQLELTWSGPLDTLVDSSVITDVEAVVREAMTNVARHAEASTLRVTIGADTDRLTVDISDDGVGLRDNPRRSGLANLRNRAAQPGWHVDPGEPGTRRSSAAMVDPAVDVVDDKRVIRVFILDDHELVRRGLTDLLDSADDMEVVGQAANAGEALRRIPAARPHVALLDARLPDGSGIEVCRDIRSSHPEVSCVILTSFDDEEALFAAVMAGASGYLLKQIRGSSLIDGIRQVAAGRSLVDPAVTRKLLERIRHPVEPDPVANSLTAREREILSLIADGYTNRQIGERVFLAEKTVKNYVSALLAKLGMQRRTQAAVYGASLKKPTEH